MGSARGAAMSVRWLKGGPTGEMKENGPAEGIGSSARGFPFFFSYFLISTLNPNQTQV
jgi:hypothetical protein